MRGAVPQSRLQRFEFGASKHEKETQNVFIQWYQ